MRGLTYSAVVGATFIFIVVISMLLWHKLYYEWAIIISSQKKISELYSNISLFEDFYYGQYFRNLSHLTIDLDKFYFRNIFLFPQVQEYIRKKCKELKFIECEPYFYNNFSYLMIARKINFSSKNLSPEIILLKLQNITRVETISLGKFTVLPSIIYTPYVVKTKFNFNEIRKLKLDNLKLFKEELLNQLKEEYQKSYPMGSNKFILILNENICDKIQNLSGIKATSKGFESNNTVVILKIESIKNKDLNKYLSNREKCKEFIKSIAPILVNFSYMLNKNSNPIVIFPRKGELIFETIEIKKGKVVCDGFGNVVKKSDWINESIASKICISASKILQKGIETAKLKEMIKKINQSFNSCPTGLPVVGCLGACGQAIASILGSLIKQAWNTLISFFGGGEAIDEYKQCLSSCDQSAKTCKCSACCGLGSLKDCKKQALDCISKCVEELRKNNISIAIKEIEVQLKYRLKMEIVDSNFIYFDPKNPDKWYLLSFYVNKTYLL